VGIFTVIFSDDNAWVIFDRCRRVYLPSDRGDNQTWTTYEQAAQVCTQLNQNDLARSNGVRLVHPNGARVQWAAFV